MSPPQEAPTAPSSRIPVELESLVAEWTLEQLRQASAAIFHDDNLPFAFTSPTASATTNRPTKEESLDAASPVVNLVLPSDGATRGLEFVGGLDVSFREDGKGDGDDGIATLAVLSWPDLKLVHSLSHEIKLSAPYIPSFLSFREAADFHSLVDECRSRGLDMPQVLFVDGNGRLHPREAGAAVAVGLATDIPTLGVAKEYHPLDAESPLELEPADPSLPFPREFRSSQKGMRLACKHLLRKRGDWIGLSGSNSPTEYIGAALRTSPDPSSTNPVFVSSGHRLSLESSLRMVMASCSASRVPEPIRQADAIGRQAARDKWGRKT